MQKYAGLSVIIMFFLAVGCDEVLDEGERDPAAAQALADSAIGVFEDDLRAFSDSIDVIESPYDIDFATSNALFKEALALDPNNLDANFGAGLTEMLIFTQDEDFKAVFDAWETFIDTGSMFVAEDLNKGSSPLGMFLPGMGAGGGFQALNKRAVAATYLNLHRLAVSDPPTIADIQGLVESLFIPTLEYIAERLELVDDSTYYTFTITSEMQGGGESPKELDMTEIYLLEVGVNLLLAFSDAITAYDVGPNAYDSTAIIEWLSQGSGFMSLRSGGVTRMALAKIALLNAADKLDAAADFLEADTDTANDIIKLMEGELTAADLQEVRDSTQSFREMFDTGISFTEDWDDNSGTPDEELTFDFDVLFTTPITDFKSILPVYTVTVGRDTSYGYQSIDTTIFVEEVINLPVAIPGDYYFSLHYEYYDDWDSARIHFDHNFPDVGIDYSQFFTTADSLKEYFIALGNVRHWDVDLNWNGPLLQGENTMSFNVYVHYDWGVADFLYYTGIITFEADVAADWIFQVANLNGLIPQFTTDAEVKRILGFKDEYFEKELIIPFDMGGGFDKAIPLDGLGRRTRSALVPWAFVR